MTFTSVYVSDPTPARMSAWLRAPLADMAMGYDSYEGFGMF